MEQEIGSSLILQVFPENIKFQHPWRKYQQRVLDSLEEYIADGHLHVIAPPGSGKTVLGLEVALRLNQPTLILAPAIAIRNQWIQRFCELFLETNLPPEWISTDIRKPGFMTVVTYQGLHAACNGLKVLEIELEEEFDEAETDRKTISNLHMEVIVAGLKRQGLKTIVVDEAHHLRNEWWQTLIHLKKSLSPVIVGLTATPPYDVTPQEWERYLELNGPVDVEISVPELVIEGDLCPHQDFVYFTSPTPLENEGIIKFRKDVERIFSEIRNDEVLIAAVESHRLWLSPAENLEWIYNNPSFYSASLIFLNANGRVVGDNYLEIIGNKKYKLPDFDFSWCEILLDFYFRNEDGAFKAFEHHRKSLENKLRWCGALEGREINLRGNNQITGLLSSSVSKLDGIKQIVDFEFGQLGNTLRQVILTDYIRKEFYVNLPENDLELNKIGVITIFEKLRRNNAAGIKIGVLTGSMVIIPKSAYAVFEVLGAEFGISDIQASLVPFDHDYLLIEQKEQLKNRLVDIITRIFQRGEIEVLIGTKSLLGEGWDAPAINSLILASFVGSFVLSNQMRGRAIRTQKGNDHKTGHIWHLACIDRTSISGGEDVEVLKRRFRSFVGVSTLKYGGIENGIARLNLSADLSLPLAAQEQNTRTFKEAANRDLLKVQWAGALQRGVNLVEEIKVPFLQKKGYQAIKKMYLDKTIANFAITLGFSFVYYFFKFLFRASREIRSVQDFYAFLGAFVVLGTLLFGRRTLKMLTLYFEYRDISKDMEQIAQALLNTLVHMGVVRSNISALKVVSSQDHLGTVYCHLEGGTNFERSTFIHMLTEMVRPVNNPRYIMIRKSVFLFFVKQKDYHAVPELIGRNKALVTFFAQQWTKLVGPCEFVFTKTIEGRKLILKSRIDSLASQLEERVQQVSIWK